MPMKAIEPINPDIDFCICDNIRSLIAFENQMLLTSSAKELKLNLNVFLFDVQVVEIFSSAFLQNVKKMLSKLMVVLNRNVNL